MTTQNWLNVIGLIFDLIGVILLFIYGLPAQIDRSGTTHLVTGHIDKEEVAKGKFYDKMGKLGLVCVIVGFLFQLVANLTAGIIE